MNGASRINEGMKCILKGPVFKFINSVPFFFIAALVSDEVSNV
jgi:hypothetical protein